MKKIIAIVLALVLIISSIAIFLIGRDGNGFAAQPGNLEVIAAERNFGTAGALGYTGQSPDISSLEIGGILSDNTPRDGYILAPTMVGLAGVDTVSSFVLRTPAGYDNSIPSISIDSQPQPVITREDSNTFIITPAVPLMPNSLYVFRLAHDSGSDITWAFQTALRFEIISTLPRHQGVNVPVRTGIEVTFSFGDAPYIEDFFSIYPHVEGRFISRDSTAIFMPLEPLSYGQIYTITISAGIGSPGTRDVINTTRIFSFETEPDSESTFHASSHIHFMDNYLEFPSFAAPSVSFWFNYNLDRARPELNINVYRIDDRAEAIAAVGKLAGSVSWSHLQWNNRIVDISDLTRVSSSRITERQGDEWAWNEVYSLPTNLPPGFYLLDASSGASRSQVIIQVTDIAVQVIADDNKALVWANCMDTGQPIAGTVHDPIGGSIYEISEYGIAVVERMLSDGEYILVASADGRENIVFLRNSAFQSFHGSWGWGITPRVESSWDDGWGWYSWRPTPSSHNYYWTALQLDRTLFQRNDTISLWGFVQNRRQDEDITHVTAVLTERSWWWNYPENDVLHMQNIPVRGGAYYGEIRLPHVDPGSYELTIYHGDIVLSSIFFSVMDYVTPPYRLSVSASSHAIFAGEDVNFTARTAFFEGTPVPDLDISYDFWGWELRTPNGGRMLTNAEGVVEMQASPTAQNATVQGERSLRFSAQATLPEIGWVYQEASVRVFINDVHVRPRATRKGPDASLTVNVHDITLDRINDQTAEHRGDFLCAPRAGHRLDVRIYEVYWVAIRIGERYCHITRQVVNRYRHERRERHLERFELTTDADGSATRDFTVPNHEHRSYEARITTTDGNGRQISHIAFIGRDFSDFFRNAGDDQPFLYGVNSEGYDIGDEVELTVMRGTEPLAQGNILFVVVQGGIFSYTIGVNPLAFTFGEQHVPNAQVFAFHFNGHTYHTGGRMAQRLHFNTTARNLLIDIYTCEESYRPGDMATFNVRITDMDGNPKAAHVNISLVDEALFALMDYSVDTLAALYGNVNDRLRFGMATHRTFISDGIDDISTEYMMRATGDMAPQAASADMAEEADDGGTGDTRIRERFEDTAVFASLRTNDRGQASFTFPLPDNITSWRVTTSAISNDLYAGNTVQNVRVTQPMFLHYTLNSVFLVGDTPYIGVNAFGSSLSGSEQISFEVWRDDAPGDIRSATGRAFERVNIPLWEKSAEGFGSIVIQATVGGYSDAIRHSYQVVNSHRHVEIASFYEVTPSTVFQVNQTGLTNITFTDHGRGQFLSSLFGMRNIWRNGARVEGLIARREATALIRTHFPDVHRLCDTGNFNVINYQTYCGGMAILPYTDADLLTTVMLIPFILDDVNMAQLKSYLRQAAADASSENRVLALYGLAMLGEPVLLDLQRHAMLDNLSIRDTAYIALGLANIGETQAARDLYESRIAPTIQRIAPYYRVYTGTTRRDILDATSITALLAAQLGMPESMGLHYYATRHRPGPATDPLINIERLKFITHEIENHTGASASITYTLFGETVTRDLWHGGQFTLRIPAQNMHEFNLVSTTGQVGAVSIARVPLEDMEAVENDITVRRQFFRAGSDTPATMFEQDELVRVQITIDYSRRAVTGSYVITDFLPAGLQLVPNSARFSRRDNAPGWWAHATAEGQRVTFFDFNGRFDRVHTYYYYARVINPGMFKAEGTLVQSIGAREYLAVGEDAVLTINP